MKTLRVVCKKSPWVIVDVEANTYKEIIETLGRKEHRFYKQIMFGWKKV